MDDYEWELFDAICDAQTTEDALSVFQRIESDHKQAQSAGAIFTQADADEIKSLVTWRPQGVDLITLGEKNFYEQRYGKVPDGKAYWKDWMRANHRAHWVGSGSHNVSA